MKLPSPIPFKFSIYIYIFNDISWLFHLFFFFNQTCILPDSFYIKVEGFLFLDHQFSVYICVDRCLSRCTFLFLVIGLSALLFTYSDYPFGTFNLFFHFLTIYTLIIYVECRYILMTLVFWFDIRSSYHYTIYFARTGYQNRLSCVV